MRKTFMFNSAVVMTLFTSFAAYASNYTQENVRKSQTIINQTLEAYGGIDKISSLQSVIIDYQVTNINAGQSRKASPPWDETSGTRLDAIDFTNEILVSRFGGTGGGNRFAGTSVINGDKSVNLNDILKTSSQVEAPDFEAAAGPGTRVNATLLLKRLQEFASSARYLGEIDYSGRPHDLLSFTIPEGPALTLYIDQKDHQISKSERVSGPFLVEYYFSQYKSVDGVLFPFENSYTVNGLPAQIFKAKSYQLNKPLTDLAKIPSGYLELEPTPPTEIATQNLGDGAYWVTQNSQNSLFVEFNDHLMMIGGLPGVTQRIAEIKKHVPNKPVKYLVMTHHHNDHIGGSQEAKDAGVTIVTVDEHQAVIRESLTEDDRETAVFDIVKNKKVYQDDKQLLEIHDIGPTPHTEHFLLAYLPRQGIIFEADHFTAPASGPMPPRSPNIERLVESIQQRGLKVKEITSAHANKVATLEQLMESYNKRL